MNDLDTLLRETFAARADAVRPAPDAYEAIVRRRRRRLRLPRAAKPLAAAVATALAVGALVVATRHEPPVVGPAATVPMPKYVIMTDGGYAWVRSTDDLAAPPVFKSREAGVGAVATLGDGRTFYYAQAKKCVTTVYRLDLPTRRLTALATVPHEVWSIALTPDESRLAYVAVEDEFFHCAEPRGEGLHVRDVATGTERFWRGAVETVRWAADGRRLAYGIGRSVDELDTTSPEGALRTRPDRVVDRRHRGRCTVTTPYYLPTGELVATEWCERGYDFSSSQVVVYDPASNTVGRTILTIGVPVDGAVLDTSGQHAYLNVWPISYPQRHGPPDQAWRWTSGSRPKRLGEDESMLLAHFIPSGGRVAW